MHTVQYDTAHCILYNTITTLWTLNYNKAHCKLYTKVMYTVPYTVHFNTADCSLYTTTVHTADLPWSGRQRKWSFPLLPAAVGHTGTAATLQGPHTGTAHCHCTLHTAAPHTLYEDPPHTPTLVPTPSQHLGTEQHWSSSLSGGPSSTGAGRAVVTVPPAVVYSLSVSCAVQCTVPAARSRRREPVPGDFNAQPFPGALGHCTALVVMVLHCIVLHCFPKQALLHPPPQNE